ncbi:MAG: hypothetical protein U9Q30_00275 [Campylobacterota bacterium]|nr:hypothetical protein [Campylobacterota bacterium]
MEKNKEQKIVTQLCQIREESDKMSLEVMDHLDIILNKVELLCESKDIKNDVSGIINNILITMESMQSQDANRQRIERIINDLDPENTKFANSAKHITGDKNDDVVDDDELAALIASMGGGS